MINFSSVLGATPKTLVEKCDYKNVLLVSKNFNTIKKIFFIGGSIGKNDGVKNREKKVHGQHEGYAPYREIGHGFSLIILP